MTERRDVTEYAKVLGKTYAAINAEDLWLYSVEVRILLWAFILKRKEVIFMVLKLFRADFMLDNGMCVSRQCRYVYAEDDYDVERFLYERYPARLDYLIDIINVKEVIPEEGKILNCNLR